MCLNPTTPLMPRPPPTSALRRALASVEVPECSCKLTLVRVCSLRGGCERARLDRRCTCPRWPRAVTSEGQPCPHLESYATRMRMSAGFLVLVRWVKQSPEDAWATLLWATDPGHYADRPAPGTGANAITQESRVQLRRLRHSLGLGLWNRADVLCPGDETRRLAATDSFLALTGRAHQ